MRSSVYCFYIEIFKLAEKVEPTNIGFAKKDEKRIPKISSDTQLEKLSRTKKRTFESRLNGILIVIFSAY